MINNNLELFIGERNRAMRWKIWKYIVEDIGYGC